MICSTEQNLDDSMSSLHSSGSSFSGSHSDWSGSVSDSDSESSRSVSSVTIPNLTPEQRFEQDQRQAPPKLLLEDMEVDNNQVAQQQTPPPDTSTSMFDDHEPDGNIRTNAKVSFGERQQFLDREEELLETIRRQKAELRSHALVVASLENTAAMHKDQSALSKALFTQLQVRLALPLVHLRKSVSESVNEADVGGVTCILFPYFAG